MTPAEERYQHLTNLIKEANDLRANIERHKVVYFDDSDKTSKDDYRLDKLKTMVQNLETEQKELEKQLKQPGALNSSALNLRPLQAEVAEVANLRREYGADNNSKLKWEGSPFPGLRSFTKKDAPIFFGRDTETEELVKKVEKSRFVAVVGASGSGKSSLVGAGLLPRLETDGIPGSKDWRVVQFTPGQAPFAALFTAILETFGGMGHSPFELSSIKQKFVEGVTGEPSGACDTLIAALHHVQAPASAEGLLFIDQFEELFTLAPPSAISSFVSMLNHLAAHPRLRVVVTIRHDFFHRAIEIPELTERLNQGFYSLAAPTFKALAQMVKRPAEYAGLVFEEGLVDQILHDTGSDPGSLALMAYTLEELYKIATVERRDYQLKEEDYQTLGKVAGAIGKRAEQAFEKLDPAKSGLVEEVFRKLVEVTDDGKATRCPARPSQFNAAEQAVIAAFTQARLLVTDQDQTEVAHEALFRSWARLKQWITEAQEDLILSRQVRNAAVEWAAKGREDAWRWPQERLVLVYAMLERLKPNLDDIEKLFIEPEQTRLLRKVADPRTTHMQRRDIGDRLSVIGDTRPGIGVREDGTPDIVWLPVAPGGEIEIEEQSYSVQPFYIAQYPVTYAQYEAFVNAPDGYYNLQWWEGMPKEYQPQKLDEQAMKSWNNPRDNISWYQSVAFTRWLDRRWRGLQLGNSGSAIGLVVGQNAQVRLPTEWEWQWAAQGGSQPREYPWEGGWQAGYANTSEAGLNRPVAVGMYPQGVAECGALDMSGQVWEWCQNKYSNSDENRVLRGGSFRHSAGHAACAYRDSYLPHPGHDPFGCRLVVACPIAQL